MIVVYLRLVVLATKSRSRTITAEGVGTKCRSMIYMDFIKKVEIGSAELSRILYYFVIAEFGLITVRLIGSYEYRRMRKTVL